MFVYARVVEGMYVFFLFFTIEGRVGLNITDKRWPGTRLPDGRNPTVSDS